MIMNYTMMHVRSWELLSSVRRGTGLCGNSLHGTRLGTVRRGVQEGRGVADPGTHPSSLLTSGVWWASHRLWDSSEEAV